MQASGMKASVEGDVTLILTDIYGEITATSTNM